MEVEGDEGGPIQPHQEFSLHQAASPYEIYTVSLVIPTSEEYYSLRPIM